ncbi:ABC transporter ATP-binding protein [Nocardia stercoris]|uniref:Fatty acid ABC transporter ATP-binding/permease protein n=1 Tax=Nocardia stercoris TaxID=2483361 RepID=A0A3M2L7W9_9NOCA|nr:ABC transporter ATP-binding protein [Nocardia stercoris]RMI33454.1 ABC transporter ATP-binding protein [Nocardia stercoris]
MSRPGGGFGGANVAPGQKPLDFKTTVRRVGKLLVAEPITMALVIALSVASVGLGVVGPKIIGHAVDEITSGYLASLRHTGAIDFDSVGRILLLALIVYLVSSVLMWWQSYLLAGVVQRAMQTLRAQVETKMHKLPLSYIDAQPRGDLLSRVTNDIDNVGQTLTQTMGQLLVNGMTVIGVLIMMLVVSPLLTLVAMVTIPLTVFVTGAVMKRSQKQFIAQWKHTGALNAQVEETFAGHELVTVFGRRREVGQKFDEHNDALAGAAFGAQFASGLIMPINMFIGNLQYVVVCVVGALRVGSGAMTLGDVVAFIQYTRQFTMPLTQLATMANQVQSGVASAERVFEILDAPEQSADGTAELPEPTSGRVEFSDVNFGYQADTPLIENLNLVAEPGRTVAIVGPTGAGKTTLVNLLMRFYDLDGGAIDLDGRDIATVPRGAVRSRIGMVLQDAWLFEGTIADNIRYGRPDASDEELLAAARAAYVDRFVHALPQGYETVLDETAGALSTGEKQLVTIARAFLADPAILILDEATSSVDTRTEVLLQEAMGALRRDRTSFVIAHRLSTIRDADVIVVMEHGRIVEQGDHAALLEARGAYYRLYQAQFEGAFLDEEEQASSPVS